MIYRNMIIRLRKELRERKVDLEREYNGLPEGELYIYDNKEGRRYYCRIPKGGNRKKEQRTGIKRDPEKLMRFVRKRYLSDALSVIEDDLAAVEELLCKYKPIDENSLMEEFAKRFPELTPGIYCGKAEINNWKNKKIARKAFHPEHLTSTASDGTSRRSLGEILIGSKLDHYGIPYQYEAKLVFPDRTFIPDFKIRRPRDGKIIYWEHVGMVDDEEYMKNFRAKLRAYEEYGIVPWDNLIITYGQADGGINEKMIDAMIQAWLL